MVDLSGAFYVSIINNNQNNNPATSPTAWTQWDLLKRWNTNETYSAGDPVTRGGLVHTSVAGGNLGNDPIGDNGTNWKSANTTVEITDFDDAVNPGNYSAIPAQTNSPTADGTNWAITVFGRNSNNITQVAHAQAFNISYQRQRVAGVFDPVWARIWSDQEYQPETLDGLGVVKVMENNSGGAIAIDATTAGSNLRRVSWDATSTIVTGTAPVGTWKNVLGLSIAAGVSATFVRIS